MVHEQGAEYQYANATAEMIAPVIEQTLLTTRKPESPRLSDLIGA